MLLNLTRFTVEDIYAMFDVRSVVCCINEAGARSFTFFDVVIKTYLELVCCNGVTRQGQVTTAEREEGS